MVCSAAMSVRAWRVELWAGPHIWHCPVKSRSRGQEGLRPTALRASGCNPARYAGRRGMADVCAYSVACQQDGATRMCHVSSSGTLFKGEM